MKLRVVLLLSCITTVFSIQGPPVYVESHLYRVYQCLQALYDVIDPFSVYQNDPLYPTLAQIQKRDYDMYVLLQKAYRVLEQAYGKPQKLSELPVFAVLADQSVKNLLAYGGVAGRGSPARRKMARKRFKLLVTLVAYADEIGRDVTAIPQSSEERNPQTCVAYLTDQDDTWWDVDLQRFAQVVEEDTSQLVSVLDRILRRINAQDAPMAFQLHVFPAFLENLAREESQQFRQQLVDYVDVQEVVQNTLKEQMQEAQQVEQQLVQPEPRGAEPEQRSQLLEQIRSGTTLRTVQEAAPDEQQLERKPRKFQETPWWQSRLEQFRQRADDISQEDMDAFIKAVNEMLSLIGPPPEAATNWFKAQVFDKFLSFMEDEDLLQDFIAKIDARKSIRQYMETLWKMRSKKELTQNQAIQLQAFQSEGGFRKAFGFGEED